METLHILNGDGLAAQLQSAGWSETHMIWKEALCQGPVAYEQNDSTSLDAREAYFIQTAGAKAQETYQAFRHILFWLTDQEFMRQFDEIVCWFGADYFCQINFIALLSIWQQEELSLPPISLVSTDFHPEVGHVTCLGNLTPQQLLGIFPQRKVVGNNMLQVADILWKLLTSEDPLPLNSFSFPIPHDELNWGRIIRLHKELFPSTANGLNVLEERVLSELIEREKPLKKVIGSLLRQDQYYGLGDRQYIQIVESLLPRIVREEGDGWNRQIGLTSFGKEIIAGNNKVDRSQLKATKIGGALETQFAWDKGQQVLVRRDG